MKAIHSETIIQMIPSRFDILLPICEYYNIDIFDAISKSRKKEYVKIREMYCKIAYGLCKKGIKKKNGTIYTRYMSYADIGEIINRDHATVINCRKSFKTHYKIESDYKQEYEEILTKFKQND